MFKGTGDAGSRGGPSGDLYVDVNIEEHSLLKETKMTSSMMFIYLLHWQHLEAPLKCLHWMVKFP